MTSRHSSRAGGVLIEVLSSGNFGTGREDIPAAVLIPRFNPVTQEIIAYRCNLPGFSGFVSSGMEPNRIRKHAKHYSQAISQLPTRCIRADALNRMVKPIDLISSLSHSFLELN